MYILKQQFKYIHMPQIISPYTYNSENALDLFHLFVDELESKIIEGYLRVGSFRLWIRYNDYSEVGNDEHKSLEQNVGYAWQGEVPTIGSFTIEAILRRGYLPQLKFQHGRYPDEKFYFKFNNAIFNEEPLLCFKKWMEIVVNGMPCVQQIAEFDHFLQTQKEARHLKKNMEFLRRSLNKSQPHSLLNSIVSNEHLKHEILKNGSRH
jgi:hypothetical protein